MPDAHMSDSDDNEFDGPISFKRSSTSVLKNRHTLSTGNLNPNSSPRHCQKGKLKRHHMADDRVDSEDDKPLGTRLSDNAVLKSGADLSGDDDDSEDDTTLAARLARVTRHASTSVSSSKSKRVLPKDRGLNHDATAPRNSIKRPGDGETRSALKKAKTSYGSASSATVSVERDHADDSDDNVPLAQRRTMMCESSESKPPAKIIGQKSSSSRKKDDRKRVKTKENSESSETTEVCQGSGGRKRWSTLQHNGVVFPPPYKPHGVKMLYNGKPVDLTPEQEEVATMFAVMKDTEYASKETFINNFFTDWRNILGKKHMIKKFELCDFTSIYEWHLQEKEKKKQMTSEEKKKLREEKTKQEDKFMWAFIDGVKETVGNFRVEPPGLFRGRGEHPKMGKLKRRIRPSDITINIGEGAPVPVCPIPGESWKEVRHDNTVTWLAFWNDPISPKDCKYVFLAASSSLKGQSDKEKYEKARKLKDHIHNIRINYTKDFRSKDQAKKEIAVATYLIDKLALRAGNEKDDDEADTVGCCTLKVENVTCLPPNKLQFDFLGKDSIRYLNTVEVELPVYEAIEEFCGGISECSFPISSSLLDLDKSFPSFSSTCFAGKNKGDRVFGKLDTSKLNAHLRNLMPDLTAKVFRTYNASITLDAILNKETKDVTLLEKLAVYQRANKEVAIICNHQRAVPKSHGSQIVKLDEKIDQLKAQRDKLEVDLKKAKKEKPRRGDKVGKRKRKLTPEVLETKISKIETKIEKKDADKKKREDLKTVALGTSKINYLDPRITVAWCKTHEVPIQDEIFSKTILEKFGWAMDVNPDFRF
ncbi:unnamed protein product [Alopecurus aequalis]